VLRPCLIHPVTPLLSLLAPLFRPFFASVRGLCSAVTEGGNHLILLVFCTDFARRAGPQKSFSPVIRRKTGERRTALPGGSIGIRPAPCHKRSSRSVSRHSRASGNRGRCPERWSWVPSFEWLPWAPAFAGVTGYVWRFPAGSVGRERFFPAGRGASACRIRRTCCSRTAFRQMHPAGPGRMKFLPWVFPCGREDGYRASRTTGLLKVPIPVISMSTVSPCLMFSGAPSVPIHTTSPG
jgi:hypothetical protein